MTCRCGCGREPGRWRDGARCGYTARCYARWADNGFPAAGPPEPRRVPGIRGSRAGRIEDYTWLRRELGLTREAAMARLGIVRRTVRRYEAELRQAQAAA
jgi:hypothetical protein